MDVKVMICFRKVKKKFLPSGRMLAARHFDKRQA